MKKRRRTRRFRSYINFFYFRFSIVLRNYRLELIIEFNEGNKKKKKRRRRRRGLTLSSNNCTRSCRVVPLGRGWQTQVLSPTSSRRSTRTWPSWERAVHQQARQARISLRRSTGCTRRATARGWGSSPSTWRPVAPTPPLPPPLPRWRSRSTTSGLQERWEVGAQSEEEVEVLSQRRQPRPRVLLPTQRTWRTARSQTR